MKKGFFKFLFVMSVALLGYASGLAAQRPYGPTSPTGLSDIVYTMQNDEQVSDRILEFDLYLQDADANEPFELAIIQAGITLNPNIYNGGTVSISILAGTSQLVAAQQPTSVVWSQAQNCIKLTPRSGPGAGNGTIISTTAPGTRICRLRITNSEAFTANSTADLTFSFTTVPYPTKVFQYIGGVNTQVTSNSTNTYSQLSNVVLNPSTPPAAYNVTGSGNYCQGGAGLEVGLDGSETGVTYTLYKNTVAQVPTVAGTGAAISFGLQTAGTYTVEGTNASGTSPMSGSAVVAETPAVPVSVSITANPGTNVNTGTSVTYTATPVNGGTPAYQWYVNSAPAGSNQGTYTYVPANGDQVYVVMTSSLECVTGNPATSNTLTMTVTTPDPFTSTWTGGGNDHMWGNPANWDNGVPGAITDVTIPGGLGTNYPTLSSAATCSGITIEDGASFIGSEYLTTTVALVKRNIVNSDFHFISTPVTGTTFGSVFPLNQQQVWVREYDEPTGNWVNKLIADPMVTGKGYTVQMTSPQTALFTGQLNAAPMVSTLSRLNASGDPGRTGWNLLGNPYTSAIDWDLTDHSQADGAVYVWSGTQYIAWNGTVGGLANGIIPAQNAFFVKTPAHGNTLTIPLTARVHDATGFYKGSASVDQMISLMVSGNGYTDEMFVHFNAQATSGFDPAYDAYKLFGQEGAPQIYSLSGGLELNINELPFTIGNKTIAVGFKNTVSGSYTLLAEGMDSFDASVPITLEDLKTELLTDLRANPDYTFAYAAGDPEHRFNLHFDKYVGMDKTTEANIAVYAIGKTIVLGNPRGLYGQAWVYDMTGRLLLQGQLDGSQEVRIPTQFSPGVYLVMVTTDRGVTSRKLTIQ